ncbi:MAG: hypothetical protein D6722_24400 [Bacteroidetes bacterium]|nr:MAG: hypothetical protein D6722_24400 [Bacteroidota bacterium]
MVFRPGDWIRLEARAGEEHYHGYIESVSDSLLVLSFQAQVPGDVDGDDWRSMRAFVPIDGISMVYDPQASRWHRFKYDYAGATMVGGGMIIAGNVIGTLVNEQRPHLSQVVSSTLILLSGTLVRAIGRDKYPVGRKWQLEVIPASGEGMETAMNL